MIPVAGAENCGLGPTQVNRAVARTDHRQVGRQAELHGADVAFAVGIHPDIAQGVFRDTEAVDGIEQLVSSLPASGHPGQHGR